MPANIFNVNGLSDAEVLLARKKYGSNRLDYKQQNTFVEAIKALAKEPMVILLLITSALYFVNGKISDGIFLACAIVLVATISLYQNSRSRNALDKLKNITQPACRVIRNGKTVEIHRDDLVMGDSLIIEEGNSIAADGIIIRSNDFSVNESILTGEAMPLYKDNTTADKNVYQGTTVASGLAVATVTAIGNRTKLGLIGKSLEDIVAEKTPLELQINDFVRKMVIAGAIVFLIVWGINYHNTHLIMDSLLQSLTLAMSILPEEIPVAFTTFMAMGAWRLMRMGTIVKQMKTVETLGSATVICTDKTGTITENRMSLAKFYSLGSSAIKSPSDMLTDNDRDLLSIAMWASEPVPFDPMDVALHAAYANAVPTDLRPQYHMVHEYPLEGIPPMMTHVLENASGHRVVAAKGAPEALMAVTHIHRAERAELEQIINSLTDEGYRVLAVGEGIAGMSNYPLRQQDITFTLKGIVAFYDPPKENIPSVLKQFYRAGIVVKIITGDYAATTAAIARQIGFRGHEKYLDGKTVMEMSDAQLWVSVSDTNIFTRMFPEAKLRVIKALKAQNEIVAMTGDGVNDGPALKAAHIGIAMGRKGTEIAKDAASLVLVNDDLAGMVDAVAAGRKIYTNLKKAIQYIISIHIPIIFTVFTPLILGWTYPNIFTPIHVIFTELIMGPTCSIIYENEPMEENAMLLSPRPFTSTFFRWHELGTSILQGLVITAGTLAIYQYGIFRGYGESLIRTMVFVTLISANVFLTLVNRSFHYSIVTTFRYRNNLVYLIIAATIIITGSLLYIRPLTRFFLFESPAAGQLLLPLGTGLASVIWYEVVKWKRRHT